MLKSSHPAEYDGSMKTSSAMLESRMREDDDHYDRAHGLYGHRPLDGELGP